MFKSSSNAIYVQLADDEYEYVYREVNRRKMKLQGWITELIREKREREEKDRKKK